MSKLKAPKVDPELIASVLAKAETGPVVEEADWDQNYTHKKIKELVTKYDIAWEKGTVGVPSDDAMADRLFEAGLELVLESGAYCVDSRRRMLWTRAEIDQVLANAPTEVTVGSGKGEVTFKRRDMEENSRVGVIGGPYGIPFPEDMFIPVTMAFAKEEIFDIVDVPSLETSYGHPIRAESAWDVLAIWQETRMVREALEKVGRPDLPIGGANSAASPLGELSATSYGGLKLTDWHHNSMMSELKLSYADLIRAAHYANTGAISHNFYNSIYGGYVGGGDGMAVAIVAGMIILRASLWGETVNPGPSHAHLSCNTFPDMIPSQALALQALARNTRLITSGFLRPVSGPVVKEIFYEIAAMTIAAIVSGGAFIKAVHTATGRFPRHSTPIEARFAGQVAKAAAGLNRVEADKMVLALIEKYKARQKTIEKGKPFEEAMNLETLEPTSEWNGMYEDAVREMEALGLKLS
jgi:methylamine---corrinoid protein Co-methyltransferase